MKQSFFILIIMILVGCATQPVPVDMATQVPEDRIISSEFLSESESSGRVVIIKDSGLMGLGCTTRVSADKKIIADIGHGEKIVLHLRPGRHTLKVWPNGICGGVYAQEKIRVKSGQELVCRIGYNVEGRFYIAQEAGSDAVPDEAVAGK